MLYDNPKIFNNFYDHIVYKRQKTENKKLRVLVGNWMG